MRTLNLRINFFWDDGDDMETFELTVPSNVSNEEILDVLKKEHEYLCEEDEEDVYGKTGRTPATLLNYICDKYYGMKLLMIEENMRQRKMKCIRFMRKFQIVIQ